MQCLVANDNEFQLMGTEVSLNKCGIKVIKAANGFQAVELAKANMKKLSFILLDLEMPILCGKEACKQLVNFLSEDRLKLFEKKTLKKEKTQKKNKSQTNFKSYKFKKESTEKLGVISLEEMYNQAQQDQIHRPLLIAFSGFLDDKIIAQCDAAGFDLCIEAPLTV